VKSSGKTSESLEEKKPKRLAIGKYTDTS